MNKQPATYQLPFVFILCLALGTNLSAQKRALAKPLNFLRPTDSYQYEKSSIKEKEKSPWIVVCDREQAQTFDRVTRAGDLILPKEELKFKDWFYVSDEKDCCIRIFKGKINATTFKIERDYIDYGWIEKKNMLLWTSSLMDENTKVRLKVFSIHSPADIEEMVQTGENQRIKMYNSPYTSTIEDEAEPYQIYFVFKKTGNKYLLGKKIDINPKLNIEELVGWVEQRKLEAWNTNILIEPNFEVVAFLERQNNPEFEFMAYASAIDAKLHSEMGNRNERKAIWTNDPAAQANSQFSTDQRRFAGGVIRFPVLSYESQQPYFASGLIGQLVAETNHSKHPENFAPAAADVLFRQSGTDLSSRLSAETLESIINNRYRIYTEVFIPKKIRGAVYPTYSLVLFMSERQLQDYINLLDLLSIDLMRPEEDLRKGLHRSLTALVKAYTTYTSLPEDYRIEDLKAAMQGISKSNIEIDAQKSFVIEDVLSSRKVSLPQVRTFATEMVKQVTPLKVILQEGKKQNFNNTSRGTTYFWIPIEYTF